MITALQLMILGKMRLTPMRGIDIKEKVGFVGSNRAFAAALLRMRDKGLIDCQSMDPITYVTTPAGLSAYLDSEPDAGGTAPKFAAVTTCGCLIPSRQDCPNPRPDGCFFKRSR